MEATGIATLVLCSLLGDSSDDDDEYENWVDDEINTVGLIASGIL